MVDFLGNLTVFWVSLNLSRFSDDFKFVVVFDGLRFFANDLLDLKFIVLDDLLLGMGCFWVFLFRLTLLLLFLRSTGCFLELFLVEKGIEFRVIIVCV